MKTVLNVIGKESYDDFLNHWMKEYFFIKGVEEKFTGLFSEQDFRQLLEMSYYHIGYPEIRLVQNGKTLDDDLITSLIPTKTYGILKKVSPKKIWNHFDSGATIIIKAINNLDRHLFELSNNFAKEFNCYVQINSYYTPKNVHGLKPHYDTHDVLLLQIYGEKEWYLSSPTFKNPLKENHFSTVEPPTNFSHHISMESNDVLYIPRGMWHYSKTTSKPSLHLTIGVHCQNYIDILNGVMDLLKKDPNIRASLPFNFDDSTAIKDIANIISPVLKKRLGLKV